MSLPSGYAPTQYTISAPYTGPWTFGWKFWAKSQVYVVASFPTIADVTMVLDTDYSLTAPGAGGTVARLSDWETKWSEDPTRLTIYRELELSQNTGYPGGPIPSVQIENDFDYAAARDQQIAEEISRTVTAPISDPTSIFPMVLPAQSVRATKFAAWDALGKWIAALGVPNVPVTAALATVLDDATLDAALATLGIPFSAFMKTVVDAANAAAALTDLGVSSYIQTLLDDSDSPTALGTLGVLPAVLADLTLSGTPITQRIIACKDLTVTASTVLKCRMLLVYGNLTINSGTVLSFEQLEGNTGNDNILFFRAGAGASAAPGGGAFGGAAGSTGTGGASGGGAYGGAGGSNASGGGGGGFGGAGGGMIAGTTGRGGGGGFGGAGGNGGTTASGSASTGGKGGELVFIVVAGTIDNQGTVRSNGQQGTGAAAGGGAGGAVVLVVQGASPTIGIIECKGAAGTNGGSNQDGGCGGGGGHIEVYARTATFSGLSVAGGAGGVGQGIGGNGNPGATGTTVTVDTSANPTSAVGGKSSDVNAGRLLRFMEKLL